MSKKSTTEHSGFGDVRFNTIIRRVAIFCKEKALDLFDFFSKSDTTKNYVLTDTQWNHAFDLINFPQKILNYDERNYLTEIFRNNDGKVNYLAFCTSIDNAAYYFGCPDDERDKKILQPDVISCRGWLPLDLEEDCMFYDLMMKIAGVCCQNGYSMKEYAEETEKTSKYGKGKVTVEHFSKMLFRAGVLLKPVEFSVIIKKFVDDNYLVNFSLFCDCITSLKDSACYVKTNEATNDLFSRKDKSKRTEVRGRDRARHLLGYNENDHPLNRYVDINEDIKTLLYRIHDHLFKYSIREFSEYFKERDTLNFGHVSRNVFMSILSMLGVSTGTLGTLVLTQEEVNRVMDFYENQHDKDRVMWKEFHNDMNSIWCYRHGTKGKTPDILLGCEVGPQFGFQSLNDRGTKYHEMSLNERIEVEDIINYEMAQRTDEAINTPLIYQFDKQGNNHMMISQFRSAMDIIGRKFSNREMELLEAKYYDQYGFNYRKYLDDVRRVTVANDPVQSLSCDFSPAFKEIEAVKREEVCYDDQPLPSVVEVMNKIRYQLQPFSPNIWQFLNQSKSNLKATLQKAQFASILSSAGAQLTDDEVEVLFITFNAGQSSPESIDYRKFYNALERLDRISLNYPPKLYPPEQVEHLIADKRLPDDKVKELQQLVQDIANTYSETAVGNVDYSSKKYMDFDRFVKELDVSLNLGQMLTTNQQLLLFRAFSKPFGNSVAINLDEFIRHLKRIKMTCKDTPGRQYLFYQNAMCG